MPLTSAVAEPTEPTRGSYVRVDQSQVMRGGSSAPILYLNRCEGGCEVTPGITSSLADTSSLVQDTASLSTWSHGNGSWSSLVSCVRGIFAPFAIEVTDVRPSGPHHEVMIAGTNLEFGADANILGISPLTCSVIPNSLTFVFANSTTNLDTICAVSAQEPAHSFGLDHELVCEDPMTYLQGCGPKRAFQDIDGDCGEDVPRPCECGGTTQNSVSKLKTIFGEAGAGSQLQIARPSEGQRVNPGFEIELEYTGATALRSLDVTVSGAPAIEIGDGLFEAPEELTGTVLVVLARGVTASGVALEESVSVLVADDGSGSAPTTTGGNPGPPRDGGCQAAGIAQPWNQRTELMLLLLLPAIVLRWRKSRPPPISSEN